MTANPPVILASSSVYRRELLGRVLREFECVSPDVPEEPIAGEAPGIMALRLAELKAREVAAARPDAIVIGSDQVPTLDGRILRKPGTRERAIRQLSDCSSRAVRFLTAAAVLGPGGAAERHVDETVVQFRALSEGEIERYVEAEQPLDCAGSFKVEGLGIALFERIDSQDPTALQGLPMIWLSNCLNRLGVQLP
ncbi:MAG: septum formation protein Maf [Gammaproteobacteria bacterium]|nr:septum formation protein Maf [Gammaproteobacteria bacterium]NND36310.1 septum formation protein Maf [Gammaproteobacteria bacterium]